MMGKLKMFILVAVTSYDLPLSIDTKNKYQHKYDFRMAS